MVALISSDVKTSQRFRDTVFAQRQFVTLQNACNAAKCTFGQLLRCWRHSENLSNSWGVTTKNHHKWRVMTSDDKDMQVRKGLQGGPDFLTFSLFSRWKEVYLGSLTTEHKEPSLYSQTTKAGPAQQNSENLNSQWHRKIENAGQSWIKAYASYGKHTKKEGTQNPSHSNFEDLCDSPIHPPGTSQHFHSQGLMCLCSPSGRDNSASRIKQKGKEKARNANILRNMQ